MHDEAPANSDDLERQATFFRSILQYALHFSSHSPIFALNYTKDDALLLNINYQPKPSYFQAQEELARVIHDGVYRLTSKTQLDKYLGTLNNGSTTSVKLFTGNCDGLNQKWAVT
ncbi:unnamed protein product [Adineta ricciae]|uniref:Uncharacterized protein n=1 Tax=Adineta ricciae TaxID=249248 RepID=A0A813SAF4_ADIRI|nr:unnamed protein product [Adineta ricciae]CAF1226989.1 unnamed protein product [Adineta ricciae]